MRYTLYLGQILLYFLCVFIGKSASNNTTVTPGSDVTGQGRAGQVTGNQINSTESNQIKSELTDQTGVKIITNRVKSNRYPVSIVSSLIEFFISESTGRQIYILYDQYAESISASSRSSNRLGGDIAIYNYKDSIKPLERELRSYTHRENMRNVIVLCSPSNTVQIFKQILEQKMETPTIYWWVILEEDVTRDILRNMREGTQISVALKTENVKYQLMRSYVNKNDQLTLQHVGSFWWTPERGAGHFLKEPIYKDLMEVYDDFGGRLLRSSVVDNWPFFRIKRDSATGRVLPDAGIDMQVLNTMAKKLNFTYQLLVAEDGQWGGVLPNGSVTGMIGMAARREVHFAINEITITGPREVVVDFTLPYFLESTTIVSPAPAEKNRAFAVFSPFTSEVWGLLSLATLLVGPILWLISYAKISYVLQTPWRKDSLSDFTFSMFRSMVVQGNHIDQKQWTHRFILFTWFFFCFVVYALYAGTLTAVLAVPAYEKPIDSLWDLLDAIKHDGFKPTVVFQTSNEFIFKEATEGIYKEVWELFDPSVGYVYTWDEGIEKVLTGKFAYMNAQLGAEIRAIKQGIHKYHFAKNTFYPQGYGMALPNGAPYKNKFEKMLITLASAGLVGKWTRDEVSKVAGSGGAKDAKGPGAITLVHLQAAFFILAIGYSTAGGVLILEKVVSLFAGGKERKLKRVM